MKTSVDIDGVRVIECRAGCGACCTAPSISSPIPGMPDGKPAGVRCIHLTADLRCAIFGHPGRPQVCASLQPSREMCGNDAREAFSYLSRLERATRLGVRRLAAALPPSRAAASRRTPKVWMDSFCP